MLIFDLSGFDFRRRDVVERPSIDPVDVMVEMARVAQRDPDPIGRAIHAAESAACVIYGQQVGPEGLRTWTGSGFLVDGGYVVTAEHVLPEAGGGDAQVYISFDGESSVPVDVVRGDSDVDVGILRSQITLPIRPVPISPTPVRPGDIIAIIGAPEGWPNVVTVGRVSATDMTPTNPPDPSWTQMMFVDARILEGSSGSMVIDVTGSVVGMVMGVIGRSVEQTGAGQNAVVPAERVVRALRNASAMRGE
jgi:S1-C subfamily serine protease